MLRTLSILLVMAAGCRSHAPARADDEREREVEHEERHEHRHATRPTSAASRMRIAEIAALETTAERLHSEAQPAWTSLGPLGGDTVDHTGVLATAESGLVEGIRADPRDPNVVFIATAGGGIWRTTKITAATPDWRPITDSLGNLGIGGFDIDPEQPDTIVAGLGEPFYETGGFIQITHDGGLSWGTPVRLGEATNVRDVRVDPLDSSLILVATDVGLFRSTDGGAHFAAIDLPNGTVVLEEAVWSIAYAGRDAGGSHWAVSAVAACDVGLAPPQESSGLPAGANCPRGNPGGIWSSSDGGATWTRSTLPVLHNGAGQVSVPGRIALASAAAGDPGATTIYGMVANRDERVTETIGIVRSSDGGVTFVSAQGSLTNPDGVCTDLNVGSVQSGYNQAIAVDPLHPERVVVAGLFCSVRSVDATAASPTWQVVSDVYGAQTSTSCGTIPYVHSDFHAALITPTGRVLLGGDGGIDASDDALTVANGAECSTHWVHANRGLATHLSYSIASGDPAYGDADVIYAGMQDLSSRWRDPANPELWNTINLSDGTGGAIARSGDQTIYWAAQVSVAGVTADRAYCRRASGVDCGLLGSWIPSNPTLPAGDSETFITLLAPLPAEAGVISQSTYHVWKADSSPAWTDITGKHCDQDGTCVTGTFAPYYLDNVAGSPTTAGVYAAALYDHAAVSSDGGATWMVSAPLGIAGSTIGWAPSSVALPPGGHGDVYAAGSESELLADGSPVPEAVGHLFITHDRGASWSSLAGSGASALPDVPVWAVKYDARDATGNSLVVATEIGVYTTSDGGHTWSRLGAGLPMVRTTDLALASDGSFVRISTWGRGMWQLDLTGTGKGDGMTPGSAGAGCGCQGTTAPGGCLALGVLALVMRPRRRRARAL